MGWDAVPEGRWVDDNSLCLELNIGASWLNQPSRNWSLEETLQKGNSYQLIWETYVRGFPLKIHAK